MKKKISLKKPTAKINYLSLLFFVILTEALGSVGSIFSTKSLDNWYLKLVKPSFNPPNWLFAPVWTLLFLLMGVALYLVVRQGLKKKKNQEAVMIFFLQFVFNIFWSYLFFGIRSPLFALLDIVVLWVLIFLTVVYFYKVNKTAGWLLLPYFLWVTFAACLNFSLYLLNR